MAASNEELIRRIGAGDAAALAAFYDRHAPRVLGLLRRALPDAGMADDALQETFCQIWRQAGKYDPERGGALTWLAVLARSRAADVRRRQRRGSGTAAAPDVPDVPAGQAPAWLEETEAAQMIRSALSSLPAEQSEVIYLAFYCGLTHEEIAQKQSLALGTVKTRIRLGIHKLRDYFESPRRALA